MDKFFRLASVSALALAVALPATTVAAQQKLVGIEALDDKIDDLQEDINDDLAKGEDSARFGNNQYAQGWAGSVALGLTASSGNSDTSDLTVAGRFRLGAGDWNHTIGFAAEYSESNSTKSKNRVFGTYDANRYLTDSFYLFGMASASYDEFATNRYDHFIGVGPGYRFVNTPDMTWRMQVGPGVRYIENAAGVSNTEGAGIFSSRFYTKITETAFLTNDTDVLFSETDTTVTNDLGVTVKISDRLATRTSLLTTYNSDPAPTKDSTDNTFTVSLVYGF